VPSSFDGLQLFGDRFARRDSKLQRDQVHARDHFDEGVVPGQADLDVGYPRKSGGIDLKLHFEKPGIAKLGGEAPGTLKQRHSKCLAVGAEEELRRRSFVNEGVLRRRQAAVAFRNGGGLAMGIRGDEHADFTWLRQILGIVDRSDMCTLRGGANGGWVGERTQYVEVGPDYGHVGLFGRARQLEHLRLALVSEVRCVGAGLFENRWELVGRNRRSFFEVDLDAPVRSFDVAACRGIFRGDDNGFHPHPPTRARDAGRGLSAPQDQYFFEHPRSIAIGSLGASRGPA